MATEPPVYAVIFSSQLAQSAVDYQDAAEEMVRLAETMPGFLGCESARGMDGFGITVCYWDSEEAIRHWKQQADHQVAQRRGHEEWYKKYFLSIAKVKRAYGVNEKGERISKWRKK